MRVYNKLVRDKIPEIIKGSGQKCSVVKLDEHYFAKELRAKFQEEANEYLKAAIDQEAMEELADVLEVIHSLAMLHGGSFQEVESLRQKKLIERGGFSKRFLLIEVEEHE